MRLRQTSCLTKSLVKNIGEVLWASVFIYAKLNEIISLNMAKAV